MWHALLILFLLFFFRGPAISQKDSSAMEDGSLTGPLFSIGFHQGMKRKASFVHPSIGWREGWHRFRLGAVLGPSYLVQAGSQGREWVPGSNFAFRGGLFIYGFRFWQPHDAVHFQAGLSLYYLREASRTEKDEEGPKGAVYGVGHSAWRRAFAGAPFLGVDLELGEGFTLSLAFQPIRYQWARYRWKGKSGDLRRGRLRSFRLMRQQFGVSYRWGGC